METNKTYNGDCLKVMRTFPDECIDSVITSPPYYQLRDYGWTGQWGLEKTYQEYLNHLIELMKECKRVLKPTGTMWINLGDSYSGSGGSGGDYNEGGLRELQPKVRPIKNEIIQKSLMLIPHRFAIRCIDELGLILRNDVIWAKRNGMPESVTDRFSKKHEFFFFLVKEQKYYFDLDGVRDKHIYLEKDNLESVGHKCKTDGNEKADSINWIGRTREERYNPKGKNPGDVSDFWDIPTQPSSEKHYATFNTKLIDKPIIAGSPKDGIILDPFCGTGTTIARAIELGRKAIGIDGSKEYCKIAEERINSVLKQETFDFN